MCHGVEPDLLGVWALLYVHPTPSSPGVNTKPKPGMTLLLGNGMEKLGRGKSLRRVSMEEPRAELCPVLTALTSHRGQPHSVLDGMPIHSHLKDRQTKAQGGPVWTTLTQHTRSRPSSQPSVVHPKWCAHHKGQYKDDFLLTRNLHNLPQRCSSKGIWFQVNLNSLSQLKDLPLCCHTTFCSSLWELCQHFV